ncbi:MAG: GNAT family N-acetyltransferase [Planctomycetota bacterium]|nr:GNAT family N-acetyltransferase [Planctomycetota bacterium]
MSTLELGVRAAVVEDADGIARVAASDGTQTRTEILPLIRTELEEIASGKLHRYTCVAEVDGTIVGYGRCAGDDTFTKGFPQLPDGWYLSGVLVLPSSRRRGVGRALTQHRMEWLRERTEIVYFLTSETNVPSVALHSEFGFVEIQRGIPPKTGDTRGIPRCLFRARFSDS